MGSLTPGSRFHPSSTVPLWLDGKEVTTKKSFDVVSPHTHKTIWQASAADEDDVQAAIAAADKAYKTWRWSKPRQRREIFMRAYEILKERKSQSFTYSHNETGAPEDMFGFEYGMAMDICFQLAAIVSAGNLGTIIDPDEEGMGSMLVKEPYGVVLGIAPWNAPFTLGLRSCLNPIAMGNTVVLKGPELAPATYWHFISILHEAGLPAGVVNTIYHDPRDAPRITNLLVSHPTIKKVKFTGSDTVGAVIGELCGKHLKPYLMELGGKGPAVVCEDADLAKAAKLGLMGAFLHSGQVCMSTERIIVVDSVMEQFKRELAKAYEDSFGPDARGPSVFVNDKGASKPRSLIEDAVSKGANLLHGVASDESCAVNQMRPLVVEGVTREMDLFHKESFGPTVALFGVGSEEEAIELANDTDFGLTAAVFTRDVQRGIKIARRIEAGAVHVNGMTIHDEPNLPLGGTKRSGFGRFNGELGLGEWVQPKTVTWREG